MYPIILFHSLDVEYNYLHNQTYETKLFFIIKIKGFFFQFKINKASSIKFKESLKKIFIFIASQIREEFHSINLLYFIIICKQILNTSTTIYTSGDHCVCVS